MVLLVLLVSYIIYQTAIDRTHDIRTQGQTLVIIDNKVMGGLIPFVPEFKTDEWLSRRLYS